MAHSSSVGRGAHIAVVALLMLLAAVALNVCRASAAPTYVPGEVVVGMHGESLAAAPQIVRTDDVTGTLTRLKADRRVRYAVRNVIARAGQTPQQQWIPNDPGFADVGGGWQRTQWYLHGPASINAPVAWANLIARGRPGAAGVTVAVVDSGVAYRAVGMLPASPELPRWRFLRGYDFVDDDNIPEDRYGHGTSIAAIIAARTNNGRGLAGIAYGARILPVRVLDADGNGDATTISRGIRYAVRRGAQIINLSLEFPVEYGATDIPQLIDAFRFARLHGVMVVVSAGNDGIDEIPYPGRSKRVLTVGATTEHGCIAEYSNQGVGLDLVAPGGGDDGAVPDAGCMPGGAKGRGISQLTLVGPRRSRLGISPREGTSMAAPMVSAAAALVIASGVIGTDPSPGAIGRHLQTTARDLGAPGYDTRYGAGLLDLAAATAPQAGGSGRANNHDATGRVMADTVRHGTE